MKVIKMAIQTLKRLPKVNLNTVRLKYHGRYTVSWNDEMSDQILLFSFGKGIIIAESAYITGYELSTIFALLGAAAVKVTHISTSWGQ